MITGREKKTIIDKYNEYNVFEIKETGFDGTLGETALEETVTQLVMPNITGLTQTINVLEKFQHVVLAIVFGRLRCKTKSITINNEAKQYVHVDFAVSVCLREGGNIVKLMGF